MIYRKIENLDREISILGLGTMRLPVLNHDNSQIDESKAIALIRFSINQGINYIDTADHYHGGQAEEIVGRALANGYRNRVALVSKCPVEKIKRFDDFERYLDRQLDRLNTDYLDGYLLHALDRESWGRVHQMGVLNFLDEVQAKGKIKLSGFSIHDGYETFEEIVDSYHWGMCMIQLNYLDTQERPGMKGLKYAQSKHLPVVCMQPLKGGLLATPPRSIVKRFEEHKGRSPIDWAFRWLVGLGGSNIILSGMSSVSQVMENVATMDRLQSEGLDNDGIQVIEEVRGLFGTFHTTRCTQCYYCMPCPVGVDIPRNLKWLDDAVLFGLVEEAQYQYNVLMTDEQQASNCIVCRQCEMKCPQKIEVSEELKRVEARLRKDPLSNGFHRNL